jgi:DNA polymerase III epsilon subunit-like protein
MITSIWGDLETTGLYPINSGPFELAFLVYKDSTLLEERVFHLNPLNDEVIIHQEALKVNGATEEIIRSYPPAKEVVPQIVEFFKKYAPPEKLVFAGYNSPFDYGHIGALLFREGYVIEDYFDGRQIDVLKLVRKTSAMGILDYTKNHKLETMTKSMNIEHNAAHTALSDIKATRRLYEAVYKKLRGKG